MDTGTDLELPPGLQQRPEGITLVSKDSTSNDTTCTGVEDERALVFSREDELFVWDEGTLTELSLPTGYSPSLGVSLTADGLSLELQDPATLGTEDGAAKLVVGVSADERMARTRGGSLDIVRGEHN